MPRPRLVIPAVVALALVAGGATTAAAKTANINVGDDFFAPMTKTIHKGTKLRFVWTGKHKHNIVTTGAATKRSPIQTTGTYAFKARRTGTIKLICELHDDMTGTITVVK